jgi:hypothetical protein
MRTRGLIAGVLGAIAIGMSGCGTGGDSIPTDPPVEMKARLISDDKSKAYDIASCDRANRDSLIAGGTDQVSELLMIIIEDGEGQVKLVNRGETPLLEGTVTSYLMGDDAMFTIEGTYPRDGSEDSFRIWGNCNPKES